MFTAHDLDSLGKKLSQDYINNKTELTDSLAKMATAKGLNQHQTSRVAEAANVESYLILMKTAEDKYINFSLADAKKAYSISQGLEKEASSVVSNDYNKPFAQITVPEVFNKFANLEGIEQSEDTKISKSESEWRKEASECSGTLQFLNDALLETNSSFEKNYLELKYQVKQAMLQNVPFADLTNVIKVAANPIGDRLSEELQKDLKDDLMHISFEKEAQYNTPPNPESKIFKVACVASGNVGRHRQLLKAIDYYHNKYSEIVKEAGIPLIVKKSKISSSPYLTKLWKEFKGFPTERPALAVAVPTAGFAYYYGKQKGKRQQGEFLRQGFAKLGPSRNPRNIFR